MSLREQTEGKIELLKLFFVVLYLAHLCACCLHWIGLSQLNENLDNWLVLVGIEQESVKVRYINSLYFSVLTMVTSGSIETNSTLEKSASIIIVLTLAGTFAYSLNTIGLILQDMFKNERELRSQIRDITHYMRYRNIQGNLQYKVRKFIEYLHHVERYGSKRGEQLFQNLSNNLKEEIKQNIFFKILQNVEFFKSNFSRDFLNQLSIMIQEKTYAPDEFILEKNNNSKGIYFIINGDVELVINLKSKYKEEIIKPFQLLKKGNIFYIESLFQKNSFQYTAKSLKVSHIGFLSLEIFNKVLKRFPLDREKFQLIKEKLIFSEDYSLL